MTSDDASDDAGAAATERGGTFSKKPAPAVLDPADELSPSLPLSPDTPSTTHCHAASRSGNTLLVRNLLRNGASPHGENLHGVPLVVLAAHGSHTGVTYSLLDAGGIQIRRSEGYSALMAAIHGGRDDIVHLLLAFGPDPNSRDAVGRMPLMAAARAWATKAVKILLGSGVQIDARTMDGCQWTTLSEALEYTHWEVVALLMVVDTSEREDDSMLPSASVDSRGRTSRTDAALELPNELPLDMRDYGGN